MTWLVAALLAGAAGLLVPGAARLPPRAATTRAFRARSPVLVAGAAAVAALVLSGLPPTRLVLVLVVAASASDVARRLAQRRRRAATLARAEAVLVSCDAVAADLRAGLPPVTALDGAAATWPEFGAVAHAARLGGDVPVALRTLAALPGAGQLRVMAAAWQVAHRSGAGLAAALELAGRTLREERAVAEVVATEMAAARATALLLGVLPFGVLALGSGFGGDPFGFLLGSLPGLFCLAAGLGLVHGGLAWLDAIAATVEQ